MTPEDYAMGCTCPVTPCPVHDDPNLTKLMDEFPGSEFAFYPEFDQAIVGAVETIAQATRLCYDRNKILDLLQKQGMSYEDALKHFEFNILGGYIGETTPVFLTHVDSL